MSGPADALSDEALLEAYQASGDLALLSSLYKRYMGLVYAVCLKYLKNQPAAEDAVMDIFETLIEKVKSYDIQRFKPWLGTVARNHCLMQLRKKSIDTVSFEPEFMHSDQKEHLSGISMASFPWDEEAGAEKQTRLEHMEQCLQQLVQQQKTCISLFYLQGKCYQEVAEMTGFALDRVRSYIQNGRRNLKICIEKKTSE